jgi:hypothetical protein
MKRTLPAVVFAVALISLCAPQSARCELIFTNTEVDENGTGFGSVLTILGLQNKSSEFGAVLWDGSDDVLTDGATNQSQTRTVAELLGAGIDESNLLVVMNVSEGNGPPPVLTLHDFDLVFQDAAGGELFRETFDAGAGLPLGTAGTGNGQSGWLFNVTFTTNAAAAATFFDTPTNRLGMEIKSDQAIENTKGAAESFYVTSPAAIGIPEPSAIIHALLALVGIVAIRSSRRPY